MIAVVSDAAQRSHVHQSNPAGRFSRVTTIDCRAGPFSSSSPSDFEMTLMGAGVAMSSTAGEDCQAPSEKLRRDRFCEVLLLGFGRHDLAAG